MVLGRRIGAVNATPNYTAQKVDSGRKLSWRMMTVIPGADEVDTEPQSAASRSGPTSVTRKMQN